jgi:hypothetical protein
MKVLMQTTAAGPDGVWELGKVVNVPDNVGKVLVERMIATEVSEKKPATKSAK